MIPCLGAPVLHGATWHMNYITCPQLCLMIIRQLLKERVIERRTPCTRQSSR